MTPQLYRALLATASEVSPALHDHMRQLGPVTMPNRKPLGIAQFLARVIIGQQLSTKAANTIWNRIKAAANESEQRIPAFFTAENLATLRACGASGNKAKALLAINEAHSDGRIAAARLRRLEPAARDAALRDLHGVGQWTIDMAGMFYFGDPDVWPEGDLAVSRTFRSYLNKRQLRRYEDTVRRFTPNRSYLALYMWRIIDGIPS